MKDNNKITRRKKGQGSIFKRSNGTYTGRIKIAGYDPFSCTGATQKEVEKKLEAFRKKTLKEEVIPQRRMVRDYIEHWLYNVKKKSLKPSSFDRLERTYLNQIKNSHVGRCQLGNITSSDIQELINEKSETLAYSTVKKVRDLLNSCFRYAVANREMSFNPVDAVLMPKQENMAKQTKGIQIFTNQELEKIEKISTVTYSNGELRYKHANFFLFLANTGLRAGEALALTWEDVDFDQRVIHIQKNASCVKNRGDADGTGKKYRVIITTAKTQKGKREVPLNDKALAALQGLKEYQETHHIQSPYIDCNDKGEILKQQTLPKILKRILEAADVPYRNVHSFRHTFATNLVDAKVDIKIISQMMGHSSVKVTYDTYVHPKLDRAYDAVKRLD